jgi:hypothetical protein
VLEYCSQQERKGVSERKRWRLGREGGRRRAHGFGEEVEVAAAWHERNESAWILKQESDEGATHMLLNSNKSVARIGRRMDMMMGRRKPTLSSPSPFPLLL